jgi:Ca-activated chloride channel family protein
VSSRRRAVLGLVVAATLAASVGCTSSHGTSAEDDPNLANCSPSDCVVIDVAVSPEKSDLMGQLGKEFNSTNPTVGERRVAVRTKTKSSGEATDELASGWPAGDANDPQPVLWSPAASAWGTVLDQRLTTAGKKPMAGRGTPLMSSPLIIAMPKPMADALGYPQKPIGWSDVLALTSNPEALAAHQDWLPFKLGKTNPNYSTSGLHAFVAQNYAATNKTSGLTAEDLANPGVAAFNEAVESSVVHYGDTTLTFLNNWYRADQRGTPYSYASAVAVEEKSVVDYNAGNPDGVLDAGEVPRKPRVPLVAVYPKEGTLFSDSPFYTLDASWVTTDQKAAAQQFIDFLQRPENQQKVLAAGFRPANPSVPLGAPLTADNGVDVNQPKTTMQLPSGAVLDDLLQKWDQQRKGARVLLVMDASGSMADDVTPGVTKLDLAKEATANSLGEFKASDLVGLREFSTQLGPQRSDDFIDLAPVAAIGPQEEGLRAQIDQLVPTNGTPLYDVVQRSMQAMIDGYDPSRINAVVLLTDGKNEDGDSSDDNRQLSALLRYLQDKTQGEAATPVRLFTIGYGAGADGGVLKQIAEAANGKYYGATADPTTITKVFTQVISNF